MAEDINTTGGAELTGPAYWERRHSENRIRMNRVFGLPDDWAPTWGPPSPIKPMRVPTVDRTCGYYGRLKSKGVI